MFNPNIQYEYGVTPDTLDVDTGLSAYYPLRENANDVSGNGHNGTATAVSFAGTYAKFNGLSSLVVIPDDDDFSFVDGSGDLPFTIMFLVSFDVVKNLPERHWLINKRGQTTDREWQISYSKPDLSSAIFAPTNVPQNDIHVTRVTETPTVTQRYIYGVTYDGSTNISGIKNYIDGVLQANTDDPVGDYASRGMSNENSDIVIGRAAWSNNFYHDGEIAEVGIWKNREFTAEEMAAAATKLLAGESLKS